METAEHRPEIDEGWLVEWVDYGLADLGRYLAKHAAFEQYLVDRDARRFDAAAVRVAS